MSSQYGQKAWTEPIGAQIFELIYTDRADYPTKIASQLNTNTQTVSNYVEGLEEVNIIVRKDQSERRQRYKADLSLLVHNWYEMVKNELVERVEYWEETGDDERADEISNILDDFKENEDQILFFAEDYLNEVFDDHKERNTVTTMSLYELLREEFVFSAMYTYLNNPGIYDEGLEWFKALYQALMVWGTAEKGRTVPIMQDLLNEELE
jgi:predicted transcriptional regulator